MNNFQVGEIVFWSHGLTYGFGVVRKVLKNHKIIPESNAGTCYEVIHVWDRVSHYKDFHYENSLKKLSEINFSPSKTVSENLEEVRLSLVPVVV